MKIPFLTEAVADMILRAFNAGGYMPNSNEVDQIRRVDPNLDETARNNLAASFTYGGGLGGGDRLASTTDCWVLLDTDNSNITTPYTNYFNIIKGQTGVPATSVSNMVMSVGRESPGAGTTPSILTIGARVDQISVSDISRATLVLGSAGDGFNKFNCGQLSGTENGVTLSSGTYQGGGIAFSSANYVNTTTVRAVKFNGSGGLFPITRGGFFDLSTTSKFGVGYDLYTNPSAHAIAIEKPSDDSLRIYATDTAAERQIYLMGSYSPGADPNCKWVQVAVGGQPAVTGQQPNNVPIEAADITATPTQLVDHKATFMVVSPDRGAVSSCALQTWHRSTGVPDYTTLNNFHTSLDLDTASETIRLFSLTGLNGGGLRTVVFATRGDRTTWAYALRSKTAATVGGLDVAEYFDTSLPTNQYAPGTVMCSDGAGKVKPSEGYASPAVVGVVTTKPGLLLGTQCELQSKEDPTKDLMVPLAMAGTTPVRVTASHGEVGAGTLLVSDGSGSAAKAPESPEPGTVIGKALEAWIGPGEGKIRMLVLNR